jgi:hypothetical protein
MTCTTTSTRKREALEKWAKYLADLRDAESSA